jgi:hypothetical protein
LRNDKYLNNYRPGYILHGTCDFLKSFKKKIILIFSSFLMQVTPQQQQVTCTMLYGTEKDEKFFLNEASAQLFWAAILSRENH